MFVIANKGHYKGGYYANINYTNCFYMEINYFSLFHDQLVTFNWKYSGGFRRGRGVTGVTSKPPSLPLIQLCLVVETFM